MTVVHARNHSPRSDASPSSESDLLDANLQIIPGKASGETLAVLNGDSIYARTHAGNEDMARTTSW